MEALQILRFDPSKVSIPMCERIGLIPIAGQMSSESQGLVRELRDSQLEEASIRGEYTFVFRNNSKHITL